MESCEQEKLIDVASGRIIKKGIFFECQETHEELESHQNEKMRPRPGKSFWEDLGEL